MGRACNKHNRDEKLIQDFSLKKKRTKETKWDAEA
jgi:hypothetical protein